MCGWGHKRGPALKTLAKLAYQAAFVERFSVMKSFAAGIWGVVASLLVFACGGGSDSSGQCSNAGACGGDIQGTWKITSSCLTFAIDTASSDSCPDQKVTATDLKMSGSITYGGDMTYNSSVTVDLSVTLLVPGSCLMRDGITLTCAQVEQGLKADADLGSATCSAVGPDCSCTLVSAPEVQMESGTYTTTASGTLTQRRASGTEDDASDFCVKGSTLTLSPHDSSMMGSPAVSGSVVLTKQ